MSNIPELPYNLYSVRDYAISCALKDTPEPDIQPLYDWLEEDGFDALIDAWSNEEIALKLGYLAETEFDDISLACQIDVDVKDLTDEMRIARAKELIEGAKDDGYICPSVHSYKLDQGCEDSPVIGCLMEIHGQSGPSIEWLGTFKNQDAFYDSLRQTNIMLFSDIDSFVDENILSLWKKS